MGAISKLHEATYQELVKLFPGYLIKENVRPEWLLSSDLTRLEIDIFIEDAKIAVEVQGAQHYEYSKFFHKSYSDFETQKRHDEEKRDLCFGRSIKLVEIACYADLSNFVYDLKQNIPTQKILEWSTQTKTKSKRQKMHFRKKKAAPIKKPGNWRQRNYAKKILKCEQIDEKNYHVYGGRDEHYLKQSDNEFGWECDCYCNTVQKSICAHILKVKQPEWE